MTGGRREVGGNDVMTFVVVGWCVTIDVSGRWQSGCACPFGWCVTELE